uniref:SCP2 domain-containing protein n=1 Tax=Caulobacter sp. (strain K31) TaxID=366602 RepID=B0T5L2_CAUSK
MKMGAKLRQGTTAWFEMVGTLMSEVAARSGLSPDLNVSLVERYTDGIELSDGLVQGIRFDILGGKPSFRVGARRDERADVTVEITAAAARALNALLSADPNYPAARDNFLSTGEMRVDGDPSRLGGWLDAVHDPIVARTS